MVTTKRVRQMEASIEYSKASIERGPDASELQPVGRAELPEADEASEGPAGCAWCLGGRNWFEA